MFNFTFRSKTAKFAIVLLAIACCLVATVSSGIITSRKNLYKTDVFQMDNINISMASPSKHLAFF
jgi:hypothetical protein